MKKLTLEELLGRTFDAYSEDGEPAAQAQDRADFIFHMTDWVADFEKLAAIYQNPSHLNSKAAQQEIFGFLIHAVPHLNAASRLVLGEVSDPFAPAKQERNQ